VTARVPEVRYDSPKVFTPRQRLTLAVLPRLLAWGLRAIMATCRCERTGAETFHAARARGPVLLAIWHETLALAGGHHRNTGWHTLTSFSFDGGLAARAIRCYGLEAVRGSTSKGGTEALEGLQRVLQAGVLVGWTLDGPRGPRREAKPGVARLAARTGAVVVPMALAASPAWRLRSWDRFIVPRPFGRHRIVYGAPIAPPADEDDASVASARLHIETTLNALQESVEAELGSGAR